MLIPRHVPMALAAALTISALACTRSATDSAPPAGAASQAQADPRQLARDIYQELVEIDTSPAHGTTAAANAMAARFRAAGFPEADIFLGGSDPAKHNLVVRYRGAPQPAVKPILLLAHLDVVDARPEDWSPDFPPFRLTEKDGFFYGRGTTDDKAMSAIFVATLLRMKQEGMTPARDVVLALTADEEGGDHNGVQWLLANHRPLVDAELGLNEGGGGQSIDGKPVANRVQASEKVYLDFTLEATNKGGHSSQPRPDNAVYDLAAALTRLRAHTFPVKLNEVTRAYFAAMARLERGALAADFQAIATAARPDPAVVGRLSAVPLYNAMLRTTCVATLLSGGHAPNALPQRAAANVNCRVLPGEDPQEVSSTLAAVIDDPSIRIIPIEEAKPSPPSPLTPDIMQPIAAITERLWPGVAVVPFMSVGATDALYFRQTGIPIYGVSGLFTDVTDARAHGRDERMGVKEFYDGQEFLWSLVTTLSGASGRQP